MNITASPLPSDIWGIDLSTKLAPDAIKRIAAQPVLGHPLQFVWRYVRLPDNSPAEDIDRAELEAWLEAGVMVLLVQHCRGSTWQAFGARGSKDGAAAAAHAALAGYPQGAHIALDLENVSNTGDDVATHCNEWTASVRAAGFEACVYVGYDCGLSPDDLFHRLTANRYWSDFGPRVVSTRGFACKQYRQVTLDGVSVDPDHAYADQLGDVLVGASAAVTA